MAFLVLVLLYTGQARYYAIKDCRDSGALCLFVPGVDLEARSPSIIWTSQLKAR